MGPRFIAYYLPQYHPFEENDLWWGKGFTEWTNVAQARPLYRGHKQPHIPADLGFYDLRLPEVREQQAQLARQAGIEGFCYYHYWFGNGKQLMQRIFNEVLQSGSPDFPFCLCWANHSWYKKLWNKNAPGRDKLLIEQQYGGDDDYRQHFESLLPAFRDHRYIRVDGRPVFIIYDPMHFADIHRFIQLWRQLAKTNGLGDFYFIATDYDSRNKDYIMSKGFDAIHNNNHTNIHHHLSLAKKIWLMIGRKYLHRPTIFQYKDAIRYMVGPECQQRDVVPVICPNWDHTPRSGYNGMVLHNPHPRYFKQLAKRAISLVKDKPQEEQLIIIKSWNEWGEGNYMEPDLEYGHGYIDALRQAIEESEQ